jgi:hypothetical protein
MSWRRDIDRIAEDVAIADLDVTESYPDPEPLPPCLGNVCVA